MAAKQRSSAEALKALLGRSEAYMAAGVLGIVMMLVVPMPTPVIDLLLAFNLALSLSILLVTAYLKDPIEFSVFPSLLLVLALFRVALSISLMRAILATANAGSVVAAFGQLLLGGNYVIGFVLYLTLVLVQFLVVTGGTSRIAEVVARFTLDAMPGKQMSIDADLNAGVITDEQARMRRIKVSAEADFYGAMDGASKFVKGDGMAAMAVTAVNLMGGLVIGMVQMGMDAKTALGTYALLTVGQGLAVQIPSLLMSAAAGLIVTRAASDSNLSDDFMKQLQNQPDAFVAAAVACGALGLVPGMPKVPMFLLAGLVGMAGYRLTVIRDKAEADAALPPPPEPDRPLDMKDHLPLETLELELGYGLVPMAIKADGGMLLDRITGLRRQIAEDLGLIVPAIRVRDNLTLPPNKYLLRMRGVNIAEGEILPRFYMAMNGGNVRDALEGEHVNDPTFGLPAVWIMPEQKGDAERRGYIVVDATSVCITHLGEAVRQHASELLTRQEIAELLEVAKREHPAIVDDLVPDVVSKSVLQSVLQNLLDERVPVRDMVSVLEALGEAATRTSSLDQMTEHVRRRLARVIIDPMLAAGELPALVLDPMLERRLTDGIVETSFGGQVQAAPSLMQGFIEGLSRQLDAIAGDGHSPVLVCSGRLRLPLRRIMKKFLARLVLLSYDEIAETNARLRTLGLVTVEEQ
ncbi:MAG: FHIPEP family type III secretion protein [Armatimonadetes bacterium]|nr:FHIPEP family type III secretion protein [Armatimonadota bacterium]